MARALGREREMRWRRATSIPVVRGSTRWEAGEHASVREYLEAKERAPGQPEVVPEHELGTLAASLYEAGATREERKELLVFLASHGSARAASEVQKFLERCEPGMRRFAQLAYDDAVQHAAPAARCLGPQDPCPCGSGSKFKNCCARRLA